MLRLGVTGLAVAARLSVGRRQLQAYLDGAKESVLRDLRERKVGRVGWGVTRCGVRARACLVF